MKSVLAFILLMLCTSVSGTTYYVSQTGSNSNSGSSSSPWATLSYACAHATKSGDIIHINAGTITETAQSNLAAGVSIAGEGVTSVIRSHYDSGAADDKNNALIRIYSSFSQQMAIIQYLISNLMEII